MILLIFLKFMIEKKKFKKKTNFINIFVLNIFDL